MHLRHQHRDVELHVHKRLAPVRHQLIQRHARIAVDAHAIRVVPDLDERQREAQLVRCVQQVHDVRHVRQVMQYGSATTVKALILKYI